MISHKHLGLETINPEDVSSHHDCRLGQWYNDHQTIERFGHDQAYIELERYHAQVHESAKAAAIEFNDHQIARAEQHLQTLEEASNNVLHHIDALIDQISSQRLRS